uniref:DEAD (Asp-Glu-Ala-Asp) box polypeptide 54 n=1 Tax=Neolamprologus brichardi TaxID=32507 RepID=A0A3Q4GDU7_NEOBR
VAMARTGSGKTAAFLIPMFEKLKAPQAQTGARALILTPTRELALQTMKFTKEVSGNYRSCRSCSIIGTPGRLMHVVMEMNLKLHSVEYVVFDEADRLFEMGFAEQLQEIIRRLPDTRQTLLFSATLPKLLVEFARAGKINCFISILLGLIQLSPSHNIETLCCKSREQLPKFVRMLNIVLKTRALVDFFFFSPDVQLLSSEGLECAYIYSALDQTARKINIGKFVHRKAMVLLVTDVAARGIDIPLLDNVINYNFPSKAKLFLHRLLCAMERYVSESLAAGLIRPSSSPVAVEFFFVDKKDGSLRPCIDYRGLNLITVKNKYPFPLLSSAFELLRGMTVFTKLDLPPLRQGGG